MYGSNHLKTIASKRCRSWVRLEMWSRHPLQGSVHWSSSMPCGIWTGDLSSRKGPMSHLLATCSCCGFVLFTSQDIKLPKWGKVWHLQTLLEQKHWQTKSMCCRSTLHHVSFCLERWRRQHVLTLSKIHRKQALNAESVGVHCIKTLWWHLIRGIDEVFSFRIMTHSTRPWRQSSWMLSWNVTVLR